LIKKIKQRVCRDKFFTADALFLFLVICFGGVDRIN